MAIINKLFLYSCMAIIVIGCIGGGTHGYIKGYRYNVPKDTLEKAIERVISEGIVIHQDSIRGYYNDDSTYVSINILEKQDRYTYTFRYYGTREYWDTAKTTEIFIAYAHDENGKGGSEGNGGVKWYDFKLKKKLTMPFEKELVSKIDSILSLKHVEE